jgi:hypothetical protein
VDAPRKRTPRRPRADDVVAFIDAGQEDAAEVDGPDPVLDFLEADDLLLERVRDETSRLCSGDVDVRQFVAG